MRSSVSHKKCSVCGIYLSVNHFYKRSDSRDGFRNDCKVCLKNRSYTAYHSGGEEVLRRRSEYYRNRISKNPNMHKDAYWKDPEKSRAQGRASYKKHRGKRLASAKEYIVNNRGKVNAAQKLYKLAKSRAVPPWINVCFGARVKIENIYRKAQELTESSGVQHHVDHIIPLRGKSVSGLHVPSNLQILTATENMKKSNRF